MRLIQKFKEIVYGPSLNVAFDRGSKDKPTIVFLHGIAATSKTWEGLEFRMDYTRHRVVALDLLGFGDSPKPSDVDYGPDVHTDYIRRTLKYIGVKTPFTIVGHSMGSILSVHYASRWPQDILQGYLVSLPMYVNPNEKIKKSTVRQTIFYEKVYTFFRKHPKFTISGSQQLRKLLKLSDGIDVNDENWIAFDRSLRNTIQKQNTYEELKKSDTTFTFLTGSLDEFVIKSAITTIANEKSYKSYIVSGVDHAVSDKMSKKIAELVNR